MPWQARNSMALSLRQDIVLKTQTKPVLWPQKRGKLHSQDQTYSNAQLQLKENMPMSGRFTLVSYMRRSVLYRNWDLTCSSKLEDSVSSFLLAETETKRCLFKSSNVLNQIAILSSVVLDNMAKLWSITKSYWLLNVYKSIYIQKDIYIYIFIST